MKINTLEKITSLLKIKKKDCSIKNKYIRKNENKTFFIKSKKY